MLNLAIKENNKRGCSIFINYCYNEKVLCYVCFGYGIRGQSWVIICQR